VIVDWIARLAYRAAYLLARAWWFLRRPETRGSVVALWHDGRVLLVRTSYRRQYTLPGGFMKRGEDARDAAARELAEELQLSIPADRLSIAWRGSRIFEHRHDTLTICELEMAGPPAFRVDGREVVWAGWIRRADAVALPLLPHVREYLEHR
jgi:8-oxo-dGTP diphosphatase